MTDLFLTGYGVAMAALRDDEDAVKTLFADLTHAEVAAVAEGAVLAMAFIVRQTATHEEVTHMLAALQALALGESS